MENKEKKKILIVDDDKFLLDMYAMKFGEHGYDIQTSFNGREALEEIDKGFTPDICLVDIIMPGMDGFDLVREIKKRNVCQNSALVILSNLGQKEDIEKGLNLGVDGYIVKASATPSEVVEKVAEITLDKGDN